MQKKNHSQFHYKNILKYLIVLTLITCTYAEEKSLWQKFKDFFSPTPTVIGDGPEYDELRKIDNEINKLEGKYSRERRLNNKKIIRKQIDELKIKRDSLAKKIKENENSKDSNNQINSSSSFKNKLTESCTKDTIFLHDTLLVHDTITIHDTLYVIVANQKQEESSSSME